MNTVNLICLVTANEDGSYTQRGWPVRAELATEIAATLGEPLVESVVTAEWVESALTLGGQAIKVGDAS